MTKYNVYYSTTPDGPWIKANITLINDVSSGNSYTITGLTEGVLYYIIVVGGKLNEQGIWVPLSGQSIGPLPNPAKDIANPNMISARTYSSKINNSSNLNMSFGVI